jgi:PAS domain S-box-containing protein
MSILQSAAIEPGSSLAAAAPSALATVLVIDDEEMVCSTLKALLGAEGFDVVTALSGEEGVELLRGRQFEVAIADLVMQGMDGIQTIAALKEIDPDIEVIILTGHATRESTIAAFRQGACDFLLKPIDMSQLRPALTRALARYRPSAALPLYEAGRKLLEAPNHQELIAAILTLAQRTMCASAAGLALVPLEGTGLRVDLSDNHGPFTQAAAERIAQIAMQAGDALRDLSFKAGHSQSGNAGIPAGSVLAYPLAVRNASLGALVLWRDEGLAPFAVFEQRRGKILAAEIAIALGNARLSCELSRKVEELKAAHGEAARAEARARAIVETAQEAIVLLDKEGVVWDLNPKAVEMFGRSREQAVGRNLADFAIPPRLLDIFRKHLETAYREGKDPLSGCLEVYALRQNGEEFPLEISTAVIETPQGKLLSTFARDITERKRAEKQTRLQTAALESAANGITIVNREGRIIWVNPAFTRLTGYPASEVIGQNPRVLKSGVQDTAFYQKLWNTVLSGEVWQGEIVNRRKDGTLYTEEMTITPVRDSSGVITHFIAIKQDITERKRAEATMAERHRLATLVAEVGVALTGAESMRQGLQRCAEILVRNIDAAFARVWTVNEKENVLELRASAGMYTHIDGGHARVPVGKFKIGHIAESGEPHLTNSVREDSWVGDPEWARREGMVAFAGYPLKVEERVIGVVATFARKPLTEATLQAFASVADSIAQFIKRKRAEEALVESEERYRLLFERNLAGVFRGTLQSRSLLDCNDAYARILGYDSRQEVLNYGKLHSFYDAAEFESVKTRLLNEKALTNHEIRFRRKDQTLVWVLANASLITRGEGEDPLVEGTLFDITERKQAEQALAHERDLLCALMDNLPDYIYFKDSESRFLRINRAHAQALGASDPAHAVGKTDFDFFALEDAKNYYEDEKKVLQTGQPLTGRVESVRQADGQLRWCSTTKVPIRDDQGRATGLVGITRDITERMRAEEALRDSEEKFRVLYESSRDAIMTLAPPEWKFTAGNPAAIALFGASDEREFVAAAPWNLSPEYQPDGELSSVKAPRMIDAAMERGSNFFEWTHKKFSGEEFFATVTLTRMIYRGQPLLQATVRDITERKRAEEALRESEEKFRGFFQGAAEGILVLNFETQKFVYANPAVCRMLGYTEEELVHLGVSDLHPQQDLERVVTEFMALARDEKTLAPAIPCLCKDGTTLYADIKASRLAVGGKDCIVGFFTDITERMRAEEALRDSEEKFRVLYESSRDAIMMTAPPEWKFTAGNPAAIALFGARDEREFVAAAPWNLSPEYQPDGELSSVKAPQMIAAAMERGSNFFEWTHKKFSGEEFFATVTLTRMIYRGQPLLQATVRDITEHKRAEEELLFKTTLLEAQSETTIDGILVVDTTGQVLLANRQFARMLSVTEEVIRTQDDKKLIEYALTQLKDPDAFLERMNYLYAHETEKTRDEIEFKDGRVFDRYSSPLQDSTGKLHGRIWYFRDITVRKRAEEALRESEDRYRDLVENSLVLIGTHDAKGRIVSLNRAAARLFEAATAEEMVGRPLTDYVPPDLLPQFHEYLKTVLHEGHAEGLMVIATPSGKCKIVEYRNTLRRQDQNEPIVRWTGQDVTERIQAEKAQEFLASLVESSQDAIIGKTLEGIIVSWNRGAEELYGYRAEEAVGKSISLLAPPDRSEQLAQFLEDVRRGKRISGIETVRVCKDGRRLDVSLTVSPVQDAAGKVTGSASIGRDITERKRAEKQTLLQTAALESAGNGIAIADREGRIIWVNPAFTRLTGYAASEVIGQSPRVLKSGTHDAAFYQKLWNTVLSGEVWQGEIVNRRKDGTLYTEDMTITPVRDVRGDITHFVTIKQDITERKRAEATMAERHRLAMLVAEVGVALTGAESTRQGLQRCAEVLVRNLDAAFARVWTVNEEEKVLELQASAGMYTHIDGGHARVPMGKFKIGRIAESGEPHLTNSVREDSWVGDPEWARREGMVAFAGYPLKVEERVLGVVASFARKTLTEATLQAFASVADNIAQFINRKQVEEALRDNEERYRVLYESSGDAIMMLAPPEWKLTAGNPAAIALFGARDKQGLVAAALWSLSPEYQPDGELSSVKAPRMMAAAMERGSNFFEWTHKKFSGEEFFATVTLTRMIYRGQPLLQATVRDITEHKRAEETLRASEERYRELFENASDLVFTADLDLRLETHPESPMATALSRFGGPNARY